MSSRQTRPLALALVLFWAIFVVHVVSVKAATVTVSWSPNSEETLAGYRVHYGTRSADYQTIDDVGNITDYAIANLSEGETYFFAATAYDLYGNESGYSEEVSYTVPKSQITDPEPTPEPTPQGDFRMETGEIAVDHNWTTVRLNQRFSDPIVIANLVGFVGDHPSVVRIHNVGPSGFDIRVQEWDYLDGIHKVEQIGYVVLERGTHTLSDGTTVLADSFRTDRTDTFDNVDFRTELSSTPVVVTSIVTVEDGTSVTGRLENVTGLGFDYMMQEQESADQVHQAETVMYVAWEESQGSCGDVSYEIKNSYNLYGNGFQTQYLDTQFMTPPVFVADMQTCVGDNPSNLRYTDKTNVSVDLQVYEEQSQDAEMDHYNESIGYMAFSVGMVTLETDGSDGSSSDTDGTDDPMDSGTTTPDDGNTPEEPAITMNMELGTVDVDHDWTRVAFAKTYTDPVVVASGLSYAGDHPSTLRIRNVSDQGFGIRVQEWDYLDGQHKVERLGYIVAERGTHILQDGTMISAGTRDLGSTNTFVSIGYAESLQTVPVVLACITSSNDDAAVASRVQNVSVDGFEAAMQEQEKSDQSHALETLSYIAWEPSSGTMDQTGFEVGTTGTNIDQTFSSVVFDTGFTDLPGLVAGMQTTAGGNPSSLRFDNLSTNSVDMMIEEEQSADQEMDHLYENIGYIVFEE
ncbi:fibronectin type III domain-containing protein [Desulfoplanes sp.]